MRSIKKHLSSVPLWAILTVLSFVSLMVMTLFFSIRYYRHSRSSTIRNEIDVSRQVSDLRILSLDQYLDGLAQFSIQPWYNATLSQALNTYQKVDEETLRESARSFVQSNFFTRNDLISLRITFIEPRLTVYRGTGSNHTIVQTVDSASITNSEEYLACETSPLNCALFATSQNGRQLLHYAHTLIRISDRKPTAIVDLILDPAYSIGQSSGTDTGRFVLLTSENRAPIFSDLPKKTEENFLKAVFSTGTTETSDNSLQNAADSSVSETEGGLLPKGDRLSDSSGYLMDINDAQYLITTGISTKYGFRLYLFSSYDRLMKAFQNTGRTVVAEGLLLFLVLMAAAYVVIRLFTRPLSQLAKKQSDFGGGDFTHIRLTGCREVTTLSDSFNKMSDSLNRLIEQNYTARINEQNAQLKALDAQLNPHFLYNTLQAIGSEALMDADGTTIYTMLTTLADCLRYTIRASDTVTLREELQYVDNYYRLQKLRKGDRLTMEKSISPDLLDVPIPKVSLQNLVENSIQHGLSDEVPAIHIRVNAETDGRNLLLSVSDDGAGISEEELRTLRALFDERRLTDPDTGVGLPNLYNRLKILYRDADILITGQTGEDHGTNVTLRIPIHPVGEIKADKPISSGSP